MGYGKRLKAAMDYRSQLVGVKCERKDVAAVADCKVQNIGMILTNAKGNDQKLSTKSHADVAAFLKVNPDWLLTGKGEMAISHSPPEPSDLSSQAKELGALLDMIPESDKLRRATAYTDAMAAILKVLRAS